MSKRVEKLIVGAVHGDTDCRDQLFEIYRPYLALISRKLAPNRIAKRCDSSDIVQQTCLEAINAIQRFRGKSEPEFTKWLMEILRTRVADAFRHHTQMKRDIQREKTAATVDGSAAIVWRSVLDDGASPSAELMRGESALALAAALYRLPEDMQQALSLRYLDECKISEIAGIMQCSTRTVARHLRRGLVELRQQLGANPNGDVP